MKFEIIVLDSDGLPQYRIDSDIITLPSIKGVDVAAKATKPKFETLNREQQIEHVLKELLDKHFFGPELMWSYREDTSIQKIDSALYQQILTVLPNIVSNK